MEEVFGQIARTLASFVEMGAVLIRSAHSPNITERHDCSTALFDAAALLLR